MSSREDKLVYEELERQKRKQEGKDRRVVRKGASQTSRVNDKEEKKRRKQLNNEIMKSTVFFAVLFFAMVGFYAYFVTLQGQEAVNNSYNKRLATYAETIVRGNIYTSGGKILAYTDVDKKGNETRVYPYDELFVHVVGMNEHGKSGIEKLCDYYLLTTNTNPVQKIINEFKEEKSIGNDVVTTLNLKLQQAAYKSLGNNDGAVVVLDNDTGKILSMVSKPDYDPNKLEKIWDSLIEEGSTESCLVNRATQGKYTPGSIFKIFTALEYIRENKNYNDFSYKCTGSRKFANYAIDCYDKTVHGTEDLTEAFANSCNGAFATIGMKLDMNQFMENSNLLLFNTKLPIALEYTSSSLKLDKNSTTFDITQTAIGQGKTLVTPIHMAMVMQAVANNGELMIPYVVSEIDGYNGAVLKSFEPQSYGNIMTEKEAKSLKKLMEAVTEYGTGRVLAHTDYKAAGKTGTAQIDSNNNVNSWFVGYGKKGKKNITVCVVIENVPDGSSKAVESAKAIMDAYFD